MRVPGRRYGSGCRSPPCCAGWPGTRRVLLFDKRGTSLSDRVVGVPTLEECSDDIRAVLDASDSDRPALFGASEGVPMSVVFAASYPERVSALVCTVAWHAICGRLTTCRPHRAGMAP